MKSLVNYGDLISQIKSLPAVDDGLKDTLITLVESVAKDLDDINKNALGSDELITTTFKTADTPPQTLSLKTLK